jgi:putative phosphoesterase
VKLGLLADIHGNAPALAAVLDAARTLGVERLLCAGDYVGYYGEPARCLELLAGWDATYVKGNHESMLQEVITEPSRAEGIRRRYGSGLALALEQLTPKQISFLTSLPVQHRLDVDGCSILLCHGAPWDTDHYIYPDAPDELLRRCAAGGEDYVVMGHTHHRFNRQVGTTTLINPGSVGQPRDRRPGAAWAWFDTSTREMQPRIEPYDIDAVVARARATDPDVPYLWEVLTRQ